MIIAVFTLPLSLGTTVST